MIEFGEPLKAEKTFLNCINHGSQYDIRVRIAAINQLLKI
jgi:hypothetical protein